MTIHSPAAPVTAPQAAPVPPVTRPVVDWMLGLAVLGMVALFVRVMAFTPLERAQGAAQKIFYVHVPAAIAAYTCFGIVALMSLVYLWLRDERADRMAAAAAEVALVFTTAVITTGPLWGKPIWGAWWVWEDMRLTLTLFLWFLGLGYLLLRGVAEDAGMRARYSAVLGVLAALLIPFIHLSVYLFRGQHPMPVVLKPEAPSLPGSMLTTLMLGFAATTFLAIVLVRARYRLALATEAADAQEDRR
jgi:heme exporter protein C